MGNKRYHLNPRKYQKGPNTPYTRSEIFGNGGNAPESGSFRIFAIDPGIKGALVGLDSVNTLLAAENLPINSERLVDFQKLKETFKRYRKEFGAFPVYLERAASFGMGTKSAFNYGRSFEATVRAVESAKLAVHFVEPAKWTKVMLDGVGKDLRPKVRAAVAAKRLFPSLVGKIPMRGKNPDEGIIDALLIAGYALRTWQTPTCRVCGKPGITIFDAVYCGEHAKARYAVPALADDDFL